MLVFAAILAVGMAMQCNDCEKYCECVKNEQKDIAKPSHDVEQVKAALEKCHEKLGEDASKALSSVDAIKNFFECRNAHCDCAEKIESAIGMALGAHKAASPAEGKGEGSRRKRQAAAKAEGNRLLKCIAEELQSGQEELQKLLKIYQKKEETYLMCFEEKCDIEEDKLINEEVKCSKRAGFAVPEKEESGDEDKGEQSVDAEDS